MAQNTAKNTKEKIVESALALAAEKGWRQTGLHDIAEKAGLGLAELHEHCEDKSDILVLLGRMIDRRVLETMGEVDETMPPRDRLFDVLMERFEVLNDYREGIGAILDSFLPDPKEAIISCPHLCRSMSWMLEAAKIETGGFRGAVKVAGLTGIYIKVLRDWKDDISPDLSKTMAALDRALGRADQIAGLLAL